MVRNSEKTSFCRNFEHRILVLYWNFVGIGELFVIVWVYLVRRAVRCCMLIMKQFLFFIFTFHLWE